MRAPFLLLAAALALGACASQERINEAKTDNILAAYRAQPARVGAIYDYVFDVLMGFKERGAPPRPPTNVQIVHLDLSVDDFAKNYKIFVDAKRAVPLADTDLMLGFHPPQALPNTCFIYQIKVGEVIKIKDGTVALIVTPRIHAAIRHHEERHCHGEEHDADNVWK